MAVRGVRLPSWHGCAEITNKTDSRRPILAASLRNRGDAGRAEAKNLECDCVANVALLRVHEYLIS